MTFLRAHRLSLGILLPVMAASPVRAADPQPYTATVESKDAGNVANAVKASAQLITLQGKVPVPPFALIERALGDIPRLKTALESFGYYANTVSITIGKHALTDPELPTFLDTVPLGQSVTVDIAVDEGPLYRLGTIGVTGLPAGVSSKPPGIRSGDPAFARNVLDAQARLRDQLQEAGYALAKVDASVAYAEDEKHLLNLKFNVTAGPRVEIGAITFKGLETVNESFARRVIPLKSGDRYQPSRIEAARRDLIAQGVFSGVSVHAADSLSADGRLPLTFDVQERKRHAVAFAGSYSTDLGISLSASWTHRNLFGNAEQLVLTAAGTGLGNATAGIGYNLTAQFIKPLFFRPDQTLEFDLSGVKQNLDAYDQTAQTLAGFLRRKFSPLWSGSVGLSIMHDEVAQEGTDAVYQLAAAPVTVSYDSTGIVDALSDPTKGLRASAAMTPAKSFGDSNLAFLTLQTSASDYFALDDKAHSVIALRGLVGSILGGSNLEVPPDQRLYAGGSATVRGFAYQSIGPRFADGNPVGAKSVDAATVEFRQRVVGDWGAAAFIDAGQASASDAPFTDALRVGAGLGARYYTPIGPVRADIAVPLNRQQGDAAFEIYIGLGQAF